MNEEQLKKLLAEAKAEAKAELMEELKKELPARKEVFGSEEKSEAQKNQEQKELTAKWLRALYRKDMSELADLSKSMNTGTDADGGYLVPEYLSSEIIRIAPEYGLVRRLARVITMPTKDYKIPTAGSVTAYRVGERASGTASKPTIGQVALSAQKLMAIVAMSSELLEDATVDTVDLVARLVAEAMAGKEDEWGLLGLTSGEGIFQHASVASVAMATGLDAFTDATFDHLLAMTSELSPRALRGARWVMSMSMFNHFRSLKHSSGTNSYIFQEPSAGQPATIWNLPVELHELMPETTDASQVSKPVLALANFDYMILGDRKSLSFKISEEATVTDSGSTERNLFEDDMVAVRGRERIDIELAEADKAFCKLVTGATS